MTIILKHSGIKIVQVRVRNFRSLKQVDVSLDDITVLIGENDSGKTSFLEALYAAIGSDRRFISDEDVYLPPSEKKVPQDRVVMIDLLIKPTDDDGNFIANFPAGSYWVALWGKGIAQDDDDNDFVAIRTQMKWNATRGEYIIERKFLIDWPVDPNKWEQARVNEMAGNISAAQTERLALYLLDAKRDIQDELRSRGSFWNKLVADTGLTDEQIEELEADLTRLNDNIVTNSSVLTHVQQHLRDLYEAMPGDKSNVSITPVPRHLRDLNKGMDVSFATKGAQTFSIARHGMGTRSLAAVLIFRAYATWRQQKAQEKNEPVHPMLALEELEAHLHPQLQRAVFNLIEAIPGQRIVSTHSPYIASQADIANFRHFRKIGADTVVTQLDVSSLSPDDIRKINRMVMNTRGDMLYARALVLFEGETEEQALPVFAKAYWRQPNALGLTFIGVGGGAYLPFLRLASSFNIPWYIFSDGEPSAIKDLQSALTQIGITDHTQQTNVVVLPDNHKFESYLVSEGYEDAIVAMLDSHHEVTDYLNNYILRMDGQKRSMTVVRDYKSAGGRERALVDVLSDSRTEYAKPLAISITSLPDDKRRFPSKIRQLFVQISNDLGIVRTNII